MYHNNENKYITLNGGTWVYTADNGYPAVAYMLKKDAYKGEKDFENSISDDVRYTYSYEYNSSLNSFYKETISSNVVPYTCAGWGNYNYLLVSYNDHQILDPKMLFVYLKENDNLSDVSFGESKTLDNWDMHPFADKYSLTFKKLAFWPSHSPLGRGCYRDPELLIAGKQKYSDFLTELNDFIESGIFIDIPGKFCSSGTDLFKKNPDPSKYLHWYYGDDTNLEPFLSIIYCQKAEKSSDDQYYLVYVNPKDDS